MIFLKKKIPFLFPISGAADLIPNYDNVEHKLKVFDETKTKPLILSCNITTAGRHTLSW